ncbi:MAG: hypothetical protein V8S34_01105 [Lawsonibacter sp.]
MAPSASKATSHGHLAAVALGACAVITQPAPFGARAASVTLGLYGHNVEAVGLGQKPDARLLCGGRLIGCDNRRW